MSLLINWADKKNSANLAEFIEKYGAQYCMTAEEINQLRDAVNAMGVIQQSTFMGTAEPGATPTGTGNRYWTAVAPGTYTNFGGVVVAVNSLAIISVTAAGVYSVSQAAYNYPTNGIIESGNTEAVSGDTVYNSINNIILSNEMPTPHSNANVLLANDVPASYTGVITKVTVNSTTAGIGTFQIIERVTKTSTNQTAGGQDTFKPVSSFTINLLTGLNTYQLSAVVQIKKGQFLAWASGTGQPACFYGGNIGTGWWQGGSGAILGEQLLTYQPMPVAFNYHIKANNINEIVTNKITAVRNVNDFNSIRNIINSINDESEFNRYEIHVPNGSWFEVDLQGKKWVSIIGEDRDKTILYCDSTLLDAKYVAPSNFSYPSEIGKQLNAINPIYLHVFFNINNQNVSNVTISMTRGKYAIHSDNPTYTECNFNNCRIKENACNYPIGIGMFGGQKLNFNKCIIERSVALNNNYLGFLMHNAYAQSEKSILNFLECKFINCGYGTIDELNSGQPDEVNVLNCTNNNLAQFMFITEAAGSPSLVPYDIKLNASGSRVDYINHTSRPDCIKNSITDYDNIAYVLDAEYIAAGDILCYGTYHNADANVPVVQKFKSLITSAALVGIALEENQNNSGSPVGFTSVRYAPLGKYALAFVNGVVGGTSEAKKLEWNNTGQYLEANINADVRHILGYAMNSKLATEPKTVIKLL